MSINVRRLLKEKDELSMNLIFFGTMRKNAHGGDARKHYSEMIRNTKDRLDKIEEWLDRARKHSN